MADIGPIFRIYRNYGEIQEGGGETPAERSEFIEHFSITKKRAGHPVERLNQESIITHLRYSNKIRPMLFVPGQGRIRVC